MYDASCLLVSLSPADSSTARKYALVSSVEYLGRDCNSSENGIGLTVIVSSGPCLAVVAGSGDWAGDEHPLERQSARTIPSIGAGLADARAVKSRETGATMCNISFGARNKGFFEPAREGRSCICLTQMLACWLFFAPNDNGVPQSRRNYTFNRKLLLGYMEAFNGYDSECKPGSGNGAGCQAASLRSPRI